MKSQASERRVVFLHRNMPPVRGQGSVDLVLTPQFYTMKRDDLPIRFAFQARKLAPSLLEEAGDPETLHYEVLRDENGWLYFAYNPEEVEGFLRSKGVEPHRIARLYFAQQFAPHLQRPVLLSGGTQALSLVEDTVTILPVTLLHDRPDRFAESLPIPEKSFAFPRGVHPAGLGKREAFLLILAATIFGGAWFIQGLNDARSADRIREELSRTVEEHPTLQSGPVRRNILEKYSTIDKRQRQIRQKIRAVGSLVSKETKLRELEMDEQGFRAFVEAPASKRTTLRQMAEEAGLETAVESRGLRIKGAWK